MNPHIMDKLHLLVEPVVRAEGCDLFDVEYKPGKGSSILRIYIDKEGGVDVEDCARVSKQLEFILDSEDAVEGKYVLEVSSPGLTRPLNKPSDYEKSVGKLVSISARKTYSGGKGGKFTGAIQSATAGKIEIRLKDGGLESFLLDDIKKANLDIEI